MSIPIRQAIQKVLDGNLRIPAFQRGFVWDGERVAYLMDSIFKGYPFGALILWRTKEQLRSEKTLGPFQLPEKDPDYPIDYVLDGQQRLTSIFGVFQTELVPDPHEDVSWTHVYYDFEAGDDLQDSRFVVLTQDEATRPRYFPIGTFFDSVSYRSETRDLIEDRVKEIDDVQSKFQELQIPTQTFETDDRGKVAIVFERVNRMGVELDTFQLLSAWTWSEDFDLQEQFRELADELAPFGFGDIGQDTNLLLRCCSAIISSEVSAPSLLSLNGTEVRERFDEITNGIRGAIDFVRTNLKVQRLSNLPYAAMVVPLAVFFAAKDGQSVKLSNNQRSELISWFWRSCFSKRYSNGVLRNLKRDLTEAHKLRITGAKGLADVTPTKLDASFFLDNGFTVGTVNTTTFVLLLAQLSPRSFVSGSPIDLGEVLKSYNRTEFHHLYPRSYLNSIGVSKGDINKLANFAFLSASDNKTLGGSAPSLYKVKMNHDSIAEVLESASCPTSLFDDDYEKFLDDRAKLLLAHAERFMERSGS